MRTRLILDITWVQTRSQNTRLNLTANNSRSYWLISRDTSKKFGLTEDGVEPTNNRAERDLRPAVIARKVSHCSRNERGARAFEAFTSVLQTIRKTNPTGMVTALIKLTSPLAPA
jgi:hypothetical protein